MTELSLCWFVVALCHITAIMSQNVAEHSSEVMMNLKDHCHPSSSKAGSIFSNQSILKENE